MDACKERSSSHHCSYRYCCALDIDKNALKKTIYVRAKAKNHHTRAARGSSR